MFHVNNQTEDMILQGQMVAIFKDFTGFYFENSGLCTAKAAYFSCVLFNFHNIYLNIN